MRGYSLVAASALVYALSVLMVRVATDAGAPVALTLLARFAFQTPFFYGQMVFKGQRLLPSTSFGRRILLLSGSFVTACSFGYVAASAWAPLGDANAILGTYPIGTLLVARVWLKEGFGYSGLPALLLSATGVAVIYANMSPADALPSTTSNLQPLGCAAAAFASITNSLSYVTIRRAGDAMTPLQNMMLFSALGLILTLPYAVFSGALAALSSEVWLRVLPSLAAVALLGALSQMMLAYGIMSPGVSAGIASLLSSSEMVWAYSLQVVVLGQPTSRGSMAGLSLIVLAIAAPLLEHEMLRRRSREVMGELKRDLSLVELQSHASPYVSAAHRIRSCTGASPVAVVADFDELERGGATTHPDDKLGKLYIKSMAAMTS